MTQGPWTRIRPLQAADVDPYTASAIEQSARVWQLPNNLAKTLGHCPALAITAIPYANALIFDVDVFNAGTQFAGFVDRPLKELCINRTSLFNRSRYSVTHHSLIGYSAFAGAGRGEEGHRKLLHLHEHVKHSGVYTQRELACLDYTVKVASDPHEVTDAEFAALKKALDDHNRGTAVPLTDFDLQFIRKWAGYSDAQHAALVDSQVVELTWLIGHFCLLNRWFTALQVPDETADDEVNFTAAYEATVPEDIRRRNDDILRGQF